MNWRHGPFGINGEYIQVSDERRGQGLLGEDLSDLVSRGWYLSGVWTVFDRTEGARAKHQSFVKGVYETDGIGAVQLAIRYEQLRFGSVEHIGTPSRDFTRVVLSSSRMISVHSSTHSSQMNTVGPAMSLRTSCWLLPQNEQ